jgi:hypothetical protein
MNLAQRSIYFTIGLFLGIVGVIFIADKKEVQFPYGPDARTLKSIRVKKEYYFSEQAQKTLQEYEIDSIRLAYLLNESDVDFSESDTDRNQPCQTYKINGDLQEIEIAMLVKRCDSSATFQEIKVVRKKDNK